MARSLLRTTAPPLPGTTEETPPVVTTDYAFLLQTIAWPAVLLLAPIMFPIAKKLGIHEIHYSMVIVCAMNIGLMMPPIGVGFYVACRIGDAKPDDVMTAIWPYIAALIVGVVVIGLFPALSTFML